MFSEQELEFFKNIKSLKSLQEKNPKLELEKVKNQLSGLAFSEYKSFLCNLKTVKVASQDFQETFQKISSLEMEISNLNSLLNSLESNSNLAIDISLLSSHHDALLELVKLPATIDSLAKNSCYDEAIQLITWVNSVLTKRFSLVIVQDISTSIQDSTDRMISRLVSGLSGPITLPSAIRVLGYLRRLGLDNEWDLKSLFLSRRGQYLDLMLARVQGNDYCKKALEVHRQVFFDILTMYHAIFIEYSSENSKTQDSIILLSSFTTLVLSEFFAIIRGRLGEIKDLSLIHSILTLSMYYGMSLGRMGLDFRFWITEFFEDTVVNLVEQTLENGTEEFIYKINSKSWKSSISNDSEILNVPGLALLSNSFTTSLNQIRILPILNNRSRIIGILSGVVSRQISAIEKLGLVNENEWQDDVMKEFEYLCHIYVTIVGPSVISGYEKVYKIKLDNFFQSETLCKWASNYKI